MAAYKRSDPKKLMQERQAIRKSQATVQIAPENIFDQMASALGAKIESNRLNAKARVLGYGPAPARSGAEVVGNKLRRRES